jgi:hypothetical protein
MEKISRSGDLKSPFDLVGDYKSPLRDVLWLIQRLTGMAKALGSQSERQMSTSVMRRAQGDCRRAKPMVSGSESAWALGSATAE